MSDKYDLIPPKVNNLDIRRKGLSLRMYIFVFLLGLSIVPLIVISFFNLHNVQEYMASIEVEYEEALLQLRLSPVESRINTYSELIRFVSNLPAVAEILDHGKTRAGSINKERAYARYTGVITRAFRKYPDIVNVRIFNRLGQECLHVKRQADQAFHIEAQDLEKLHVGDDSFEKAIGLAEDEIIVVPKVVKAQSSDKESLPRLLLQIVIPIRLNDETIGVYMSDVDIGVLSQFFPNVCWVFSDGNYLSAKERGISAFEHFPGLKKIFTIGRPALLGEEIKLAWCPLYHGDKNDLVLWAGQEVHQDAVNMARKRIYFGIIVTSVIFGVFVLFIAYFMSTRVLSFFTGLLKSLESTILHDFKSIKAKYTKISEVDEFLSKLEVLTNAHKRLECERRAAQNSLRQNEQMLLTVANAVQSAVILIDETDSVQFLNTAAEHMFGYSQAEILGRKLHETIAPESFREKARAGFDHFSNTGKGTVFEHSMELIARRKDNTEFPIELYVGRVRKDGRWWAVGSAIDISKRKIKEQALKRLAETDSLTGVNNRRNFILLADQELKRCRRYKLPLFFFMLDLDYFKAINDNFGHAAGDEVLRQFSCICTSNLRDSDLFGRIGGEEFAAVLVNLDQKEALNVAERIRVAFTHIVVQSAGRTIDINTSVSIGVANIDPNKDTVESALKQADQALYAAKEQGRNRVIFQTNEEEFHK